MKDNTIYYGMAKSYIFLLLSCCMFHHYLCSSMKSAKDVGGFFNNWILLTKRPKICWRHTCKTPYWTASFQTSIAVEGCKLWILYCLSLKNSCVFQTFAKGAHPKCIPWYWIFFYFPSFPSTALDKKTPPLPVLKRCISE